MIAAAFLPLALMMCWRGALALARPPRRPPPVRRGADPEPDRLASVTIVPVAPSIPGVRALRRLARVVGLGAATLAAAATAGPLLGLAVVVAAVGVLPRWRHVRQRRWATRCIAADVPDTVDLLVVLVHAGLTPLQAIPVLAERSPRSWRPGWAAVDDARRRGVRFVDALDELTGTLGPPAIGVVEALASSERYGHPLGPVLDRLATESRADRRRLAEADARRLPVRLSFPLVCCTLPSFVLLTIAPLLAGALSSLTLPGGHP